MTRFQRCRDCGEVREKTRFNVVGICDACQTKQHCPKCGRLVLPAKLRDVGCTECTGQIAKNAVRESRRKDL